MCTYVYIDAYMYLKSDGNSIADMHEAVVAASRPSCTCLVFQVGRVGRVQRHVRWRNAGHTFAIIALLGLLGFGLLGTWNPVFAGLRS